MVTGVWGGARNGKGVGEWEVHTVVCKTGHKDVFVHHGEWSHCFVTTLDGE